MTKRIPKVALLIETSREFGRSFLYGVARYSRTHGPWMFYKETGGLEDSVSKIKNWGADAVITRTLKNAESLHSLNIPIIHMVHGEVKDSPCPSVVTDNENIGRMAAEHFLDCGFQNFAFCGFDTLTWSVQRGQFFEQFLQKAGFSVNFYTQPKSLRLQRWENEQSLLANWLKGLPKPVAVMACNDDRGQHVIEACKMVGIKIPEEVAVLGVDNDVLVCDLSEPPLSSVALNIEKSGYSAAELLDNLMHGGKMVGQKIVTEPTHIITRRSTDIICIQDADVAEALRFIRSNYRNPITVDDVVGALTISRRVLEKRFRELLNRSVLEEIRKVRTDAAARMLVETDMSVSQISEKLGYTEMAHLSRYFHRAKGVSPIAFRKNIRPK